MSTGSLDCTLGQMSGIRSRFDRRKVSRWQYSFWFPPISCQFSQAEQDLYQGVIRMDMDLAYFSLS